MRYALKTIVFAVLLLAAATAAFAVESSSFDSSLGVSFADLRKVPLTLTEPNLKPAVMTPVSRRDQGRGGNDRRDCRAYDDGWEEHWGGHGGGSDYARSCRECLGRHGGCTYRCSIAMHRCNAEWRAEDGTSRTYEGRPRRDRYEAEDDAVGVCRDANWNNRSQGSCRATTCSSVDEVVDRGRCRK